MGHPQLKLISRVDAPSPSFEHEASADPVRRVFDHWLFMTGRNPARTKLGPQRRHAIAAFLVLYTEADAELAVEGNLIDAWCVENARHDIDWLLTGESRVERFMLLGERLREHAAKAQARRERAADVAEGPAPDPQAAQAARERMRALVDQYRRSGGLRG